MHVVTTVQDTDAETCLSNFAAVFTDNREFVTTLLSADTKGTPFHFTIFLRNFPLLRLPRKTLVLL